MLNAKTISAAVDPVSCCTGRRRDDQEERNGAGRGSLSSLPSKPAFRRGAGVEPVLATEAAVSGQGRPALLIGHEIAVGAEVGAARAIFGAPRVGVEFLRHRGR